MAYPVGHKTIFVLDHGPEFSASCQQSMEFDIFTKTRQPGIIPLAPISKSLWTCSVEAAMEYCRIVWDIFPTGKLIRFIVSDNAAQNLNTWQEDQQNLNHLMSAFAHVGPPQSTKSRRTCSITHGINAAVEALTECSTTQHQMRTCISENAPSKILNKGRIICISLYKSEAEVKEIEECFQKAVFQNNKLAASSDSHMVIHQCELVMVHIYPVNKECLIAEKPKHTLSPSATSELHTVKSGRHLAAMLGILVQQHYNLASTTVTGIPMKEEQNANSSANYDVELLHPAAAHAEVFKTGVVSTDVQVTTMKEGQIYETVTLKWCTPRSSSVELQYCTSSFRITPVDVNSRPSSCLTNFLLNGRAVMLEMPRKSGSKVMSHMLACHGGEIFIHTLGTGRSILEDPPSISEGCGGRVTDYRINDFGQFMKQNKLGPLELPPSDMEPNSEQAKRKLLRHTQYWPMVISHTTIFNMIPQMSPLLQLITKETLTEDEVLECKKVIFNIVGFETKGTSLPVPTVGTRGKGPKKEEQYRLMWNELEAFIRCNCLTDEHQQVLDCLLECRKPNLEGEGASSIASVRMQLGVVQGASNPVSIKKIERSHSKEERTDSGKSYDSDDMKRDIHSLRASDNQDDSMSLKTSPSKKIKFSTRSTTSQSLLEIWTSRLNLKHSKHHVEFAGRALGSQVKLYSNLSTENNNET